MDQVIAQEVLIWLQQSREVIEAQAPLLAQEVLRFYLFDYGLLLAFGLTALVGSVSCLRAARKVKNEPELPLNEFARGGSWLIIVISSLILLAATSAIGKALLAPRLVVIQQMAALL